MSTNLLDLVNRFSGRRVLVVGEAMLDSYLAGSAGRLSREAPVPIVSVGQVEDAPGGAANAAANVCSLGGEVRFLSVIGDDDAGGRLGAALRGAGVPLDDLVVSSRSTLAKQRVVADGQLLLRFDQGDVAPLGPELERQLVRRLAPAHRWAEVVLVSDYGYGLMTEPLIDALALLQDERELPLVVDAKQPTRFSRLAPTMVKPNYAEAVALLGERALTPVGSRAEQIVGHGAALLDACAARMAVVTIDAEGALLFERGSAPYRTYARPAANDHAAGAGDTFVAAFALALGGAASGPVASEAASAAAAVSTGKRGTATCSQGELLDQLAGWPKQAVDAEAAARRIAAERGRGQRIVFTNGCFDILHRGHVTYLNRAKALGDVLVVGLNTDAGVVRLKGPGRPINPFDDRAQVLAALSSVDLIVGFDEPTPERLIRLLRPDVYAKGGDYTLERLPEAPLVRELGGEVHILPIVEDRSTTRIIERIGNGWGAPVAAAVGGEQ